MKRYPVAGVVALAAVGLSAWGLLGGEWGDGSRASRVHAASPGGQGQEAPPGQYAQRQGNAGADARGRVIVRMEGFESDEGKALVALFTSSDGFPEDNERADHLASVTIQDGVARAELVEVIPGAFAVAVFHDEDDDRELDTDLFGIPDEGIGFSGDCEIEMSAPDFDDCAVWLEPGDEMSIDIEILYL